MAGEKYLRGVYGSATRSINLILDLDTATEGGHPREEAALGWRTVRARDSDSQPCKQVLLLYGKAYRATEAAAVGVPEPHGRSEACAE